MNLPDGLIGENALLMGLSAGGVSRIVSAVELDVPDLRGLSWRSQMSFRDSVRALLTFLPIDTQIQIQWTVDNDYGTALLNYAAVPSDWQNAPWSSWLRQEIAGEAEEAMDEGNLRRERVVIWFHRRISFSVGRLLSANDFRTRLNEEQVQLTQNIRDWCGVLWRMPWRLLDGREMAWHWWAFLNPSRANQSEEFFRYDPDKSLLENFVSGQAVPTKTSHKGVGIYYDGLYHGFLVMRRLPSITMPMQVRALTGALDRNIRISVMLDRQDPQTTIAAENVRIRKLRRTANMGQEEADTEIAQARERLAAIKSGEVAPFRMYYGVHVWAPSPEALASNISSAKAAMLSMDGAQAHEIAHPVQCRHHFESHLPGWTTLARKGWRIYAESTFLPNLLPMSRTYEGHMEEGHALFSGCDYNLVGVRLWAGGTPQHMAVLGGTGSGKSVDMLSLMSQVEPFVDFLAIVESGLSYATYTALHGVRPIILDPNGKDTLNPFDTHGRPLQDGHIGFIATLLLRIAGAAKEERDNYRRLGMLTHYVRQLYEDVFADWAEDHPERHEQVLVEAYLLASRRGQFAGTTEQEREESGYEWWSQRSDDERHGLLASIRDHHWREAVEFSKTEGARVMAHGYAHFSPEQYPQFSTLVELLGSAPHEDHDLQEVRDLRSALSSWRAKGGSHGHLIDGCSNLDLSGEQSRARTGKTLLHFELGRLSQGDQVMQGVGALLINFAVRQAIAQRPRNERKLWLLEEVPTFADFPGGAAQVEEAFAQARKFNCQVTAVAQNFSQLTQRGLGRVIANNAQQFWIKRQQDTEDLKHLGEVLGLPQAVLETIRRMPLPANLPPGDRYSATYLAEPHPEEGWRGGVIHHYAPKPLLYVGDSEGDKFEERRQALAQYEDPVEGVFAECGMPEINEFLKEQQTSGSGKNYEEA